MKVSNFAARLKVALNIRNLNQSDLCKQTGIKKSAMSQYLKGGFEPKHDRLQKIATALAVSEIWLKGYDVPMEPSSEAFTAHEKKVIFAYRDQPQTQPFVDRLLGIEEPTLRMVPQEEPAKIAAFDGDNDTVIPQGTYQERKVLLKKIEEKQNNNKE